MRLISSILILLISVASFAQTPVGQDILSDFLDNESIVNAPLSICVSNLDTDSIVLAHNADLCITPASVQKILTSAAAIKILGKDYQFKTQIAYSGFINNRKLIGSLIIKGGGDPSLGSEYVFGKDNKAFYDEWIKAIRLAGIDTVYGNIMADPSIYSDQQAPRTWIWEDMGNYYGAAASGISLYDNTYKLIFQTDSIEGGRTEIVRTEPNIPGLILNNEVVAAADNRDGSIVYGSSFDSYRVIKGTLPMGRKEFAVRASIPDPALLLAYELKEEMEEAGIVVTGNVSVNKRLQSIPVDSILLSWTSPPLHKIIRELNFFSVNLFAEHLCKHLGLIKQGEGTTEAGSKVIKEFWKTQGLNTDFMFLADGSGLSRANALSAQNLVDVLTIMHKDSLLADSFVNSLPLTGVQGTQQYYFKNSILKGKAHIKSGSMTRVRSFAGYMETEHGTPLAFAVIINNFNKGSFPMARDLEKLIEEIYLNY